MCIVIKYRGREWLFISFLSPLKVLLYSPKLIFHAFYFPMIIYKPSKLISNYFWYFSNAVDPLQIPVRDIILQYTFSEVYVKITKESFCSPLFQWRKYSFSNIRKWVFSRTYISKEYNMAIKLLCILEYNFLLPLWLH